MSEKSEIESFKAAKERLLLAYNTKQLELQTMRKELIAVGLITDDGTPTRKTKKAKAPKASTKAKKAGRKRGKNVKLDEAAVLKFIGDKEVGYAEVAKHFKKSPQTTKIWMDKCGKLSKRHEDPKNKKSKVLYKVK
jgi:hypothetical protein